MTEQVHKRRKRYKGTHPKNFSEKYKELNPELYPETIEKVISKGSTPAGMHISIMVDEILEFLDIQPGQIGLDCTLGYGGHSSKMMEKLEGQGHLYGLDIDTIEIEKTTERLRNKGYGEDIFTPILTNFRNIDQVSEKYGPFDFVLADLGVSSMQIDNPERGFSYKKNGPLDLRLNPKAGRPAYEILKDNEINNDTRLLILPASAEIYKQAIHEGYIDAFIDAGAIICNPGCGPCLGGHMGVLSEGETCISTTNRNFKGRMGDPKSSVYLANSKVVAASAIEGVITNPKDL